MWWLTSLYFCTLHFHKFSSPQEELLKGAGTQVTTHFHKLPTPTTNSMDYGIENDSCALPKQSKGEVKVEKRLQRISSVHEDGPELGQTATVKEEGEKRD